MGHKINLPILLAIGIGFGIFYYMVLLVSIDSLGTASFILYGNRAIIPLISAICCTLAGIIPFLTVTYWYSYIENLIISFAKNKDDGDGNDE